MSYDVDRRNRSTGVGSMWSQEQSETSWQRNHEVKPYVFAQTTNVIALVSHGSAWYGVSLGPGDIVLDGYQAPTRKGDTAPAKGGAQQPHQFLARGYCGETAGWIMMPLGTEVGLGPGHVVLDGDPTPTPKRGHSSPPVFGPCLLWPNGWINHELGPGHIVLDGDPARPWRGTQQLLLG